MILEVSVFSDGQCIHRINIPEKPLQFQSFLCGGFSLPSRGLLNVVIMFL